MVEVEATPNRFHCWCPCGNCEEFKHCNGNECDFRERGQGESSHLECTVCGLCCDIGDVATNLRSGWPSCCGYTMRLYTVREMAEKLDLR